ncbi:hypothetical protein ACR777_21970 [Sphingobacterium spiritivorum]|uniref:hypothetical protein n=1 Tax=Sphingobacterium spiritivorum TaxID=258 RepID=UPI003DA1CAB3
MKNIEIITLKSSFVLIDMPDNYDVYKVHTERGIYSKLCPVNEMNENQWKDIVDLHYSQLGFEDYDSDCEFNVLNTATESGLSLLRANGVVLENLFGEEPALSDYIFEEHPELVGNPKEYDHDKFEYDHSYWAKAQSEVWNNPYIFIKL